jgi:hypothetical protein
MDTSIENSALKMKNERNSERLLILSRRFCFLSPLNFLYSLTDLSAHAWVISSTEISKQKQPEGLEENKTVARKGGTVAKKARVEIEKQTGKPVIMDTSTIYLPMLG